MDERNDDGGLDGRILRNIRFQAGRLARLKPIRCFDAEDYAQDLTCDLWRRRRFFERSRASFATFADRVVRHRAIVLTKPTDRKSAERDLLSLNARVASDEGEQEELVELLPDEAPPIDLSVGMAIDVRRFIAGLPQPLLVCCELLLADSITAGAAEAGIHRSTAYERAQRLKAHALASGLDAYFVGRSDTSGDERVCGDEGALRHRSADPETIPMTIRGRPPRISLLIDERDLSEWLTAARPGEVLRYHRGSLPIDRLAHGSRLRDHDQQQLHVVANRLHALAAAGHGHLLQRRHGSGDYSYLFVLRYNSDRASGAVLPVAAEIARDVTGLLAGAS